MALSISRLICVIGVTLVPCYPMSTENFLKRSYTCKLYTTSVYFFLLLGDLKSLSSEPFEEYDREYKWTLPACRS